MNIGQLGIIAAGLSAFVLIVLVAVNLRRVVSPRQGEPSGSAQAAEPAPRNEFAYADLSPCLYYSWLDDDPSRFKSVGWLSKNRPYTHGKADSALFQKLLALLAEPWTPVCFPHRIDCPFCPIINPDHGKKKQPWWAMRRVDVDGIQLVDLRTPEAMAHLEMHRITRGGAQAVFESSTLFVPSGGFLFVAHPMLAHFIDAHGYAPPAEFWEAVRVCPPMNSQPYLESLLFNGPRNKNWPAAVWAGSVLRVPDESPDPPPPETFNANNSA